MKCANLFIVPLLLVALSAFAQGERVIVSDDEPQLTNLPTVYITTTNMQDPYDKIHEIRCRVVIVNGEERLVDSAAIRERGNFSRGFPKKPYHIRFDSKHSVLGSPAKAKRWTLINNYGDKTLMRNLLAFDLSKRLEMPYTPFGTPVDVVVNGDYKGCYQLCDQIHVHKNRVEVDEGGFLIEADAYADSEHVWFYSNNWTPITIHYPNEDVITWDQQEAIKKIFNNVEQTSHPNLDIETFLRHFLVGEISGNTDTYWSTYFYKNSTSDTVYTGPVWDFDLAYENDNRTYPICNNNDYIYRTKGSCAGDMKQFTDDVVRRSPGKARLKTLYAHYRDNGAITEQALIGVVDSMENLIRESAELNFQRWPILNQYVHQNPRVGYTYQQEVQWVRDYIAERIAWMDKKLNYVPSSEGIDQIPFFSDDDKDEASKVLYNGHIYILRNNRIYTISGQEVK